MAATDSSVGATANEKTQMMAYRQMILDLIAECSNAQQSGISLSEIRFCLLPVKIQPFLTKSADFLDWIREDREFAIFYFDVQQSGVCAKPNEVVGMILEMIILDALEDAPA